MLDGVIAQVGVDHLAPSLGQAASIRLERTRRIRLLARAPLLDVLLHRAHESRRREERAVKSYCWVRCKELRSQATQTGRVVTQQAVEKEQHPPEVRRTTAMRRASGGLHAVRTLMMHPKVDHRPRRACVPVATLLSRRAHTTWGLLDQRIFSSRCELAL